jgi:hypothetical protein
MVADGESMIKAQRALILLAAVSFFTASAVGCVSQPSLYRWGVYEDMLYQSYKNPGESDPITDAARLAEDVERTAAEGLAVPPGVHAHLGYLYATQGDLGLARAHFDRELELYPESKTFIDGLLNRMDRP